MRFKFHAILFAFAFCLLAACSGGIQGSDVGGDGSNPVGGPVGGQGQPTIQPGADHQPGIPTEDASYKDTFAPAPPPDDPDEPPTGATDLKAP